MGTRDTHIKTLLRACELVGGETELARKLGAPEWRVGQWLRGEAEVPDGIFLQAADVVHAHSPQQLREE
jgi:DNA-binding transcriptional regulator YdaS (Cro superfamily)